MGGNRSGWRTGETFWQAPPPGQAGCAHLQSSRSLKAVYLETPVPLPLPVHNRYLQQVGPTPLTPLRLEPDQPVIWCKLEYLNPSGSTKDRIAGYILEKAWRDGKIGPGSMVIEASSGSTSIAMALTCAQLGMRFVAVMPEGVSNERSLIIRSYGGEVVFSPKAEGIRGSVALAERLACERGAFLPRQFTNLDNAAAHRFRTAPEIVAQIPGGTVDAVVSGVGTGGTLVGLYQGFRDCGCPARPFAARPVTGKAVPDAECCSYSMRIPGVVDGISQIFRKEALPDLVEIEVDDDAALATARQLIRKGFPVGPSSGLNFLAALEAARRLSPEAQVVTVFPDRMERYFSTELFRGV
jgi:cysteine synthase A